MMRQTRIEPLSLKRARSLRSKMTDAERKLWHSLRGRQMGGFRFRRQHVLGCYIVDFICLEARLIVEVDGSQHIERKEYDLQRSAWLVEQGFRILRFWDNEVLLALDGVLNQIAQALDMPAPNPHPGLPP